MLGTVRINESVGVYFHPDAEELDAEIKRVRAELDALLERKRNIKNRVAGLDEINREVSVLRRERDKARIEKKEAAEELGL